MNRSVAAGKPPCRMPAHPVAPCAAPCAVMCTASLRRLACAVGLAALFTGQVLAAGPASGQWHFDVTLDGKSIGRHTFDLATRGDERELVSRADFAVRLLGIPAYRYRHRATERWRGDCLVAMDADTDDDGKRLKVEAAMADGVLAVQRAGGAQRLAACTMSFAYWHPGLLQQTRLLNAQTGVYDEVRIEGVGTDERGRHVRLHGPEQPVDLWYAPDGDWLALESKVSNGKRTLRYERVRGAPASE